MPNTPRHSDTVHGYDGFSGISQAHLAGALRDLHRDPSHARRLIGELARANPEMALAILAEAREAESRTLGGEIACLRGALLVIASQVRRQRTDAVRSLFCPET
ncbi:MAG TPA: hypothetical protein VK978_01520 [Candidatus Saccharimonadales bacterium]|nr:hypothetical protein [Candidatus Saccharimonadales bacterium]